MVFSICEKYFVIFVILKLISIQSYTSESIDYKYILLWTNKTAPISTNMREGDISFRNRKCPFTNCYLTSNRQLLGDVANFDAILFNGREIPDNASLLPQSRSPHQKYIYGIMESGVRFPVCDQIYNNYFNWTWTYKLNSDEYYGYITIRDKEGKLIGPKQEMHWEKVEDMIPIDGNLKEKLSTKKIAAAWFVSNCRTPSNRELVARQLKRELAEYGMQLDIYGRCGTKVCPRAIMKDCLRKLQTDYYFYLSFENSFAEDYVTEKLLHALNYYTIPVVYGGANYTRFMPEGTYLQAQQTGIKELAKEMVDIINDKERYYEYFKWHNYYSYHEPRDARETDAYCKFCELVNNEEKSKTTVYEDFTQWWTPPHVCK